MRIMCSCALFITALSAMASMLDPLYDFDYVRTGIKGLYITGGPEINLDNGMYDKDGNKVTKTIDSSGTEVDYKYKGLDIWVPIRLGYSFNARYSAGVVVPVASLSHTATTGGVDYTEANTALGNPWIWGRGCLIDALAQNIRIRLGFKIPVGAYTMEDQAKDRFNNPTADVKATTGDKNPAIDLAIMDTACPETVPFRMDASLALRYNLEGTYKYQATDPVTGGIINAETKVTPGMWLDLRAMPGWAFCSNSVQAFLWLEYAMMLTDTTISPSYDGVAAYETKIKGGSMATVGIRGDYALDTYNNLELKFLYDVMANGGKLNDTAGSSVDQPAGISFGLGYFGYIPM